MPLLSCQRAWASVLLSPILPAFLSSPSSRCPLLMFALPAGLQLGWLIYERARALTGAASHISGWISLLLSDVDGEVGVLLERLGHRVEALTPSLTFALAWSSDKGSAVGDVAFQAKTELFRVESFIHQCLRQQGQVKLLDRDWLIRQLQGHLKELEFCIQAVNLSVSLINASRPYQPQSSVVSASALLRASDRLQSMHDTGGDVTCSFGALFVQQLSTDHTDGGAAQTGDGRWEGRVRMEETFLSGGVQEGHSQRPLDASTFLTDFDHFSADPDKKNRGTASGGETAEQGRGGVGGGRGARALQETSSSSLLRTGGEEVFAESPAAVPPPVLSPFPAPLYPASLSAVMPSAPVCDARTSLNASVVDAKEEAEDEEQQRSRPPHSYPHSPVQHDQSAESFLLEREDSPPLASSAAANHPSPLDHNTAPPRWERMSAPTRRHTRAALLQLHGDQSPDAEPLIF